MAFPKTMAGETTSEHPKVVRTPGVFDILTSKCASRHNGVHFFDISTSKTAPRMVCFVLRVTTACTFSTSQLPKVLGTCCAFSFFTCKCASRIFAPQRRALFRHLNFQNGPDLVCFVDFEMCFAPQRRALFSTSQLPKSGPDLVF